MIFSWVIGDSGLGLQAVPAPHGCF